MNKTIKIAILALLLSPTAQADDWQIKTMTQGTFLGYGSSQLRKTLFETGAVVSADYLDQGGVSLGYTHSWLDYKSNIPQLNQDAYFLSLRKHFYLDAGKLSVRADGHVIDNNDATNTTDNVGAFATQVSFLTNDKQYYADFGYARSFYSGLHVDQYTPTLGFALFDSYGWLQLRGYFIETSNPDKAQGLSGTQAGEIKYTHWLDPDGWYKPNNLQLSGLVGRRFYTVDMDAASVANLADVQTGGISAGAEWKLGDQGKLLLLGGNNFYRNRLLNDSYSGGFGYMNVSYNW